MIKKITSLLLILMFCFALVPAAQEAAIQSNFIANGDFESIKSDGATLYNWSLLSNANDQGKVILSTDKVSGNYAVQMAVDQATGKRNTLLQRLEGFVAGETYNFEAFIKPISESGSISFQFEFGSARLFNYTYNTFSEGYQKFSESFVAPEGVTSCWMYLRVYSGEFLVDDVSLTGLRLITSLPEEEVPEQDTTPPEGEVKNIPNSLYVSGLGNIVPNSGFETLQYGYPKPWSNFGSQYTKSVSGFGHESSKCLMLTSRKSSAYPYTNQFIPVYGGGTYQVSIWVCMEPKSGLADSAYLGRFGIKHEYYTADGFLNEDTKYLCGGTDGNWQQFVYTFTPPARTERMSIFPRFYGIGTAWIDDVEVSCLVKPPALSVTTDEVFYYSDHTDSGVATSKVHTAIYPELEGENVTFALKKGDEVLATMPATKTTDGKFTCNFDVGLLTEKKTEYLMTATVGEHTNSWKIYKYDRPLYIGKDGVYRKNGKVIQPFYAYNYVERQYVYGLKDASLNLTTIAVPTNLEGAALVASVRETLDKAYEKGIMCMIATYSDMKPGGHPDNRARTELLAQNLYDHPGLFGWMNMDEPFLHLDDPRDDLRQTYISIRNYDPYHPVYTTEQGSLESGQYVDILGVDPYPGSKREPEKYPGDRVREAVESVKGRKPVYSVLQALDWDNYWPTADEMKNMIYQSLMAGASGIGFYRFTSAIDGKDLDETNLWPMLTDFAHNEWDDAYAAFIKDDYPLFRSIKNENYWMQSFVKDNVVHMVVANRTDAAQEITIPLLASNGKNKIKEYSATLLGSQDTISGSESLSITLPLSSVAIYKITPENVDDLAGIVKPEQTGFTDLYGFSFAQESIASLDKAGVLYKPNPIMFSPYEKISRGEFAYMLNKALNFPRDKFGDKFSDALGSKYYAQALSNGKAIGVLLPEENNSFRPDESITRQEAVDICLRGLRYKKGTSISKKILAALTTDDLLGMTFAPALAATMLETRFLAKKEGTNLFDDTLSRAEAAVVIEKVRKLMFDKSSEFSNLTADASRKVAKILMGKVTFTSEIFNKVNGDISVIYNGGYSLYEFSKNIGTSTVSILQGKDEVTVSDGVLKAKVPQNTFFIVAGASAVRRGFLSGQIIYFYPTVGSRVQMEEDTVLALYNLEEGYKELLGIYKNQDIIPEAAETFSFLRWDEFLRPKNEVSMEIALLDIDEDGQLHIIGEIGDGLKII